MTDGDPKPTGPERVSSSEAKEILRAAAEIDSVGDELVDLRELRLAAQDAGISAEAFDRSVAQYRSGKAPVARPRPQPPVSRGRPSYLAATGAGVFGAATAVAFVSMILGMGPSDSAIAGAVFGSAGSISALLAYLRFVVRRDEPSGDGERGKEVGPYVFGADGTPTEHG